MGYTTFECPSCLKNSRMIVLDIETTGLDIIFNTIIEIGVIEVQFGKIVKEYSTLFGGGRSSLYLTRKIHHIKDSDRIGKPKFSERADKLSKYLSNSVIVTHNGLNFDIPMLNQKFSEIGVRMDNVKFIDTYVIAKKLNCFESNSLENLSKVFNLEYGAHRGLGDSKTTLQLLYAFIDKYGEDVLKFK